MKYGAGVAAVVGAFVVLFILTRVIPFTHVIIWVILGIGVLTAVVLILHSFRTLDGQRGVRPRPGK